MEKPDLVHKVTWKAPTLCTEGTEKSSGRTLMARVFDVYSSQH